MGIFENMAAERARAMVSSQTPASWKVNQAAIAALRNEGALDGLEEDSGLEALSLFGLPVTLDESDGSARPYFALVSRLT